MAVGKSDWLISICGLNCAVCDIHLAGRGHEKIRDEIVEWFRKQRNQTIDPEKIKCEGCRGPPDAHWSADCKMLQCARKRGIQYCFECSEFPCTLLNEFSADGVAHHKRTVENMKKMKEVGIETWIEDQKRKGQCSFCP